jgi:glycosyltransferase involved in cell wall biosynthesis
MAASSLPPQTGASLPLRVLLTTEATYPFHWGGVSTWCHALIRELPEVEFSLLAMSAGLYERARFEFHPNLVEFRAVPLWGLRNAWELDTQLPRAREVYRRRQRTTEASLQEGFLPSYRILLAQLLGEERDDEALARALHSIYRFVGTHDFDRSFRSRVVWETFCEEVHARFPQLVEQIGYRDTKISLVELTSAYQWLYHWLFPLARTLPETDVVHATMTGLCALIAVVCKFEYGSGFLLSEHGVYLRECYFAYHRNTGSLFGKFLKISFARRMTQLAYSYADVVAPCCDYNHRWEKRLGVDARRIRTAYFGVDADLHSPQERRSAESPVVAWAGRIDPLKDVETLLRAAAVVHEALPEVRFLLYGSTPPGNERYQERCLKLHAELGLEGVVSFEGYSDNVVEAFAGSDLAVLSSISEAFPLSTLEAMLCGKPVVATDVGGIAEQVTPDCGRVVRPRDPEALGRAIIEVLSDSELRLNLARAARERATSLFGVERFRATHRSIYDLVLEAREPLALPASSDPAPLDGRSSARRQRPESRAWSAEKRRRWPRTATEPAGAIETAYR